MTESDGGIRMKEGSIWSFRVVRPWWYRPASRTCTLVLGLLFFFWLISPEKLKSWSHRYQRWLDLKAV